MDNSEPDRAFALNVIGGCNFTEAKSCEMYTVVLEKGLLLKKWMMLATRQYLWNTVNSWLSEIYSDAIYTSLWKQASLASRLHNVWPSSMLRTANLEYCSLLFEWPDFGFGSLQSLTV